MRVTLRNTLSSAHQRRAGTNHKPLIHVCAAKRTQLKIIGLDSIPTALRYRIEDKEELESSTQGPYGLEPTLGLHVDSSCKADPLQKIQWDCPK